MRGRGGAAKGTGRGESPCGCEGRSNAMAPMRRKLKESADRPGPAGVGGAVLPDSPSEEEGEGDPLSAPCEEVGHYLRDLSHGPAQDGSQPQRQGHALAEIADAVPQVLERPSQALRTVSPAPQNSTKHQGGEEEVPRPSSIGLLVGGE